MGGIAVAHGATVAALVCGSVALITLALYSATSAAGAVLAGAMLVGNLDVPRLAGVSSVTLMLVLAIGFVAIQPAPSIIATRRLRFPAWTISFIAVVVVSGSTAAGMSGLTTPFLAGLLAFLLLNRDPRKLLIAIGVVGFLHASLGLYESFTHTSVVYTIWKDSASADVNGIRRAASTVGDPNYLAVTLLCAIPGVAYLLRNGPTIARILIYTGYALAFILTFSRGGSVAIVVAIFYFVFLQRRSAILSKVFLGSVVISACLALLVMLTPLGAALFGRFTLTDSSVHSRSILQTEALRLFIENWATGLGLGSLPAHLAPTAFSIVPMNEFGVRAFLPQTNPLNTFLLAGAEAGVIALSLVVIILVFGLVSSARRYPIISAAVMSAIVACATLDLAQSITLWCLLIISTNVRALDSLQIEGRPEKDTDFETANTKRRTGVHHYTPEDSVQSKS